MKDKEYIEESFRDMIDLGYSAKEAIARLRNDENVDQEVLDDLIWEAEAIS